MRSNVSRMLCSVSEEASQQDGGVNAESALKYMPASGAHLALSIT